MPMQLRSLNEALDTMMRQILSAEKQNARDLPRMAKKCENQQLRDALEKHAEITRRQIDRLEKAFGELGKRARASKSETLRGLTDDSRELLSAKGDDLVREASLIAAAQRFEHFEIAAYGTAATWAKQLGQDRVAQLLHETLEEEKQSDQLLSEIAQRQINQEAIEHSQPK